MNVNSKKELKRVLMNHGLNEEIFLTAKKAGLDLTHLFYDKILKYCINYNSLNEMEKEERNNFINRGMYEVSSALYGVLGNYYAYKFFSDNGFDTSLEVSLYDKENNLKAKPDLCIKGENDNVIYGEVKTISQIIGNTKNYVDLDNPVLSYRQDFDIKKYQSVGEKLLKQLRKIKMYSSNAMAVVYRDCVIDEVILREIKKMGAVIYRIGNRGFSDIEKEVDVYLSGVINDFKDNIKFSEEFETSIE